MQGEGLRKRCSSAYNVAVVGVFFLNELAYSHTETIFAYQCADLKVMSARNRIHRN